MIIKSKISPDQLFRYKDKIYHFVNNEFETNDKKMIEYFEKDRNAYDVPVILELKNKKK